MNTIAGINYPIALQPAQQSSEVSKAEKGFETMLTGMIAQVQQQQQQADAAIQQLHAGESGNLHEVMIAMEQADISLRFMVQVRNKALEAYQELMRMQL